MNVQLFSNSNQEIFAQYKIANTFSYGFFQKCQCFKFYSKSMIHLSSFCICCETEVKILFFFHICACSITSVVSQLFVTLWTVAPQAPLSMRFSRQEYWSGLPRPPPGCLPNPGIEPAFPVLQVDSLLLNHWGSTPFYLHLAT